MRKAFFTGGKSQRVWWLRFLVFIQAPQVQLLGRELRSRFTPPLTAASPRSTPTAEGTLLGKVPAVLSRAHSSGLAQVFRGKGSDPSTNIYLLCRLVIGIYSHHGRIPSTYYTPTPCQGHFTMNLSNIAKRFKCVTWAESLAHISCSLKLLPIC